MWKQTPATEPFRTNGPSAAEPVTEEELGAIFERLDTARDIFRQNRELRAILSRRETETRELRSRNAELEGVLQKYSPMLMDVATSLGLAAKNEEPEAPGHPNHLSE
jgi:hypothetical protein